MERTFKFKATFLDYAFQMGDTSVMPAGRPKSFCTHEALERAMDVFWDHGYESTSMAQLIEAMGIGRQSLYDTYGDKRALFLAALNHYVDTKFQAVLQSLDDTRPAIEILRSTFACWKQSNTECHRGCLLSNAMNEFASADPEVAKIQAEQLARLSDKLASVFTRGQIEGSVTQDIPPESLARTLVTLVQGLVTMGRGSADPTFVAESVNTFERLITHPAHQTPQPTH